MSPFHYYVCLLFSGVLNACHFAYSRATWLYY